MCNLQPFYSQKLWKDLILVILIITVRCWSSQTHYQNHWVNGCSTDSCWDCFEAVLFHEKKETKRVRKICPCSILWSIKAMCFHFFCKRAHKSKLIMLDIADLNQSTDETKAKYLLALIIAWIPLTSHWFTRGFSFYFSERS